MSAITKISKLQQQLACQHVRRCLLLPLPAVLRQHCVPVGYNAASRALADIKPLLLQGLPLPPTYIFPDNVPGNAGLCRFETSLATMPTEPVTSQQVSGQNPAIFAYQDDPESLVYNALGNITAPLLVIVGTLDDIVSVQDDILLVERVPGASFLQFADAGHAAILQHAVEAGEVISAFLDS